VGEGSDRGEDAGFWEEVKMVSSQDSNPAPLRLRLWYDNIAVAELLNAIVHQGTWFAEYRQVVTRAKGIQAARICEYVAFSEKWHERFREGMDPNAMEFDQFKDVVYSGLWRPACAGGTLTMAEGPIFVEGEVSWNHPESNTGTEEAAFDVWSRLRRIEHQH
jgi:hypothetical protein